MDVLTKWFNATKQYLLDADRWADIGIAALKICIILTIGAIVVRIARAVVRNAFRMEVVRQFKFQNVVQLQ